MQVAQALFQIQAEILDVDSDFMTGRWQVGANLNFSSTEAPRPFRKEFSGNTAMEIANPFRGDAGIFGGFFQQRLKATRDIYRNTLGDFAVGERTHSRRQLARGI